MATRTQCTAPCRSGPFTLRSWAILVRKRVVGRSTAAANMAATWLPIPHACPLTLPCLPLCHPSPADPLVETASLASVPLPPPSFPHSLHDCVAGKLLSDAQLETVVYAGMKFGGPKLPDGKRAGFFLGDGASAALQGGAAAGCL